MHTLSLRESAILGCGSQQHTRRRNHNAYLLRWKTEGFLFDPGEATQRQFIFASIAPTAVTRIFVSHFHGDHCLGLGAMILRLNLDKVLHPIHIYYPESGKKYFDNLRYSSIYTQTITYKELASYLGVELEARVLVSDVRKAVLALRAAKGMLLDSNDHDTWSAGSFFVNPIVSAEVAASLPADAPRWIQDDGRVKTSAAWLMEHAGVKKGETRNGAGISTKHVLALVNTGSATASDIVEIAREARSAVKDKFGIVLEPEVQFVGLSL